LNKTDAIARGWFMLNRPKPSDRGPLKPAHPKSPIDA